MATNNSLDPTIVTTTDDTVRSEAIQSAATSAQAAPGIEASRREFMGFAFAAAATGLFLPETLSGDTPSLLQETGVNCVVGGHIGQELVSPGAILTGQDKPGILSGLIDLVVESRALSYYAGGGAYNCQMHTLRAYQGYQGWTTNPSKRVTQVGVCSPGPTLRPSIGDTVELIFLNQIDTSKFNSTVLTSIKNSFNSCDTVNGAAGLPGGYPGNDATNFPNCFHASNTSNLHWHGTHTTPSGFGDNVLVGVLPNLGLSSAAMLQGCIAAYGQWNQGNDPTKALQVAATAALGVLALSPQAKNDPNFKAQVTAAIASNLNNAKHGEWPQYWPGYYPHHFPLPIWSGKDNVYPVMGQSPGTHWYHCHQHGSTALQLLNGLTGALIITDYYPGGGAYYPGGPARPAGYDYKLLQLGGGTVANPKIKEQVMVCQLFAEEPNQLNASPTVGTVAVNGQIAPKVTMAQGEVQWWRMVDAMMKAHGIENFLFLSSQTWDYYKANPGQLANGQPPSGTQKGGVVPQLFQTAQDGVQFAWQNFSSQLPNGQSTFHFAPGNRIDFLVKAPAVNSTSYLVFWPPAGGPPPIGDIQSNLVLMLVVNGAPTGQNTQLPTTQDQFPEQPAFLADIPQPRHTRTITFDMHPPKNPAVPPAEGSSGPGTQPFFYINDVQFAEGVVNQTMMKGDSEEWILENKSLNSIQHPFHIHINPFQVTEIYDPNTMSAPQQLPPPWVWWDVIPIPAGKLGSDGKTITPGHVKMRTRFVDFTGMYVFHCHILGHEDRGMMQLVQVVDNATVIKHH
jgi:FtsP/CotA-like multicopper oxidase with cupredoxin domain